MTVTTSEVSAGAKLVNKNLISDQLWSRLTKRIAKDEAMELPLAERIMDQSLGFLRLCAESPEGRYSPSPMVDIGWHTFILYTRDYAAFCQELGGRFIHHEPSDKEGVDYGTGNIARTVVALRQYGVAVDDSLWTEASQDCADYCSGDSCSGGGCDGDSGCQH